MTVRFTVKCPNLAKYKAKGISPDEAKTMKAGAIKSQEAINEKYNARGEELGDILIGKLADVDMTWCNDGCIVISCVNSLAEVEQVIDEEGLEIQADRSDIKHKVKPVSDADDADTEEDIDEVFEPKTATDTKKLKSKKVINQYKAKKVA